MCTAGRKSDERGEAMGGRTSDGCRDVGGEEVEKSCCFAYMKDPRVKTEQPVSDDAVGLSPSTTVTPKYKFKLICFSVSTSGGSQQISARECEKQNEKAFVVLRLSLIWRIIILQGVFWGDIM